jgi:hypothetical protein
MAHADEYHDVEVAKEHLRDVHRVGENRINDEHDAKPLFTRDLGLLRFRMTLHDRGAVLDHILSEHAGEVDAGEIGAAHRKVGSGFGDTTALSWHARMLHPVRS